MPGKLTTYERMRDKRATPEPFGAKTRRPRRKQPRFVVQEHHATALHWDFRLERDGVLVSWAVPKGLPVDPKTNHLAVHTEDHPLDYYDFEGEIPKGQYGGGKVVLWDQGTYEVEEWEDRKVKVVLHGRRVEGEYVLFQTNGKNWMMHRVSPPADPDYVEMPDSVVPMLASTGSALPDRPEEWAYEFKWDGVRAIVYVDGGRARAQSRNLLDITGSYPELVELGKAVGSRRLVLDGELVVFDANGRSDFGLLQQRMKLTGDAVRRAAKTYPVHYLVFDVLYVDGRDVTRLPYTERRALLDSLGLNGPSWQTPPSFPGEGEAVRKASIENGFEGIMAKRLDSCYYPGKRVDAWRKVKNVRRQELVVGGWTKGEGARAGHLGSLLVGYHDETGLRYAGHVGTGFNAKTLLDLEKTLEPLARKESPFADKVPTAYAKKSTYVDPTLVVEVEFTEWTRDGKLRHPSYKGLRFDKAATDVVREENW
ncbi:MAG TPA: non-homologous end-joining DNA ligase [Mycobacteriales bacterium]